MLLPWWKKMRGEAVTLPKAYCISLARDTALWTYIDFTRVIFFNFMFRSACDGWQKQAMCLHQVVRSSVNPPPKPLKCLWVFWRTFLSWTEVSEWHSRFKASQVSAENYERSGWPNTSKMTENAEKFKNSSIKTVDEQSMSSQTSLGSVTHMGCARS
jgi:hypothetical protein